jgi:uncharacterized protein YjdB
MSLSSSVSRLESSWRRFAYAQVCVSCHAACKSVVALIFLVTVACSGHTRVDSGSGAAGASTTGEGEAGSIGEAGNAATAEGGADAGEGGFPSGGGPNAGLTAIALVPAQTTLVVGAELPLVVMGTFAGGTQQDVTGQALFVSSNLDVAAVRSRILVARAIGQTTVTASVGVLSTDATVTVDAQRVTAITVTTLKPTLAVDDGTQLSAAATMADGSQRDVTASAVWTSGDAKVARLVQMGFLVAMGQGMTTITAAVGAVSGSVAETVTGDTLTSYTIAGAHVMEPGDQSMLQLYAQYVSNRDVRERDALWQSSDPSVLTVSDTGQVTAVAVGKATITALLGTTVAASADVTVTSAVLLSVQLVGQNVYDFCNPPFIQAIGTFSDGSTFDVSELITGASTDSSVSVDNLGTDRMRIDPSALGAAEVELDVGDVAGSALFTAVLGTLASITVGPPGSFPVASSTPMYASANCPDQGPSFDVTSLVQWVSDDPTVVTIDSVIDSTEALGVSAGTTDIRASYPGFTIDSVPVTIFDAAPVALQINPDTANLNVADSFPMQALGQFPDGNLYPLTSSCIWSTSDPQIATISNTAGSIGNLTAVSSGSATITAQFGALTAIAVIDVL